VRRAVSILVLLRGYVRWNLIMRCLKSVKGVVDSGVRSEIPNVVPSQTTSTRHALTVVSRQTTSE